MNKVLVTGAGGYVGARIYQDLRKHFEVFGTYNKTKLTKDLLELDITSQNQTIDIFNKIKPNYVVHCAAFPITPKDEASKKLLEEANYRGMDNIVEAANRHGTKLVFISSWLALTPEDVYGKSKEYGEVKCREALAGYLIIRPHTIFGLSPNTINDRSFNRILKNIRDKTPAVYDTSWKFQTTYIGHISEVIKLYIEGKIENNLISVAFEDLKSKYEVGCDILKNFGIEVIGKNEHSGRPAVKLDLDEFRKLNLPINTYQEMITRIVGEIRGTLTGNTSKN